VPPGAIPLAAGTEDGDFRLIRDNAGLVPGTRVLMLAALAEVRADPEPFLRMAEAGDNGLRASAQAASSHQIGV
jgi:hypothetical protein